MTIIYVFQQVITFPFVRLLIVILYSITLQLQLYNISRKYLQVDPLSFVISLLLLVLSF